MSITTKASKMASPKKLTVEIISLQIAQVLPELAAIIGEKKFGKRIKKAAKLLMKGILIDDAANQLEMEVSAIKIPAAKKQAIKKPVKNTIPVKKPAAATKVPAKKITNKIAVKKPAVKKIAAAKNKVTAI